VHGYSGFRAPFHDQLYVDLRRFPDEASIARLREVGVNYVVVHRELYSPEEWAVIEPRLMSSAGIRLAPRTRVDESIRCDRKASL